VKTVGVHVLAILGLALLCGLWVVLQLASGEKAPGAQGECGACSHKQDCDS
jgi:hypothetical protein